MSIGSTARQEQMPRQEGAWWPAWEDWLCRHSTDRVAPPAMGTPNRGYPILGDAPGTYVYKQ